MEDASDNKTAAVSLDNNVQLPGRARSGSASSGHKRSSSGSLLSRLSFLRMMQATQHPAESEHAGLEADDDRDDFGSGGGLKSGRAAMSTALQHRKTRRRRGSLRKTALLGTRFDYRDKKTSRAAADAVRGEAGGGGGGGGGQLEQGQLQLRPRSQPGLSRLPPASHARMRSFADPVSLRNSGFEGGRRDRRDNNDWTLMMDVPQRVRSAASAPQYTSSRSKENILGEDVITTDDEDIIVSFPPRKSTAAVSGAFHSSSTSSNSGAGAGLRIPTPSSSMDSYYALQTDQEYRSPHRAKSPLATHPADITVSQEMGWDYSETEWWGWIILIVTWLVFVVGMGSCFGVWSWAWDVGETPYAPPELEDDPTLPIVGYYPALIILTAVMSWVWVVVAWVGMKYFKHANITGDDI
ncbi:hypothetical protein ARAM_006758 [Aspergillus rambellii]|uniref:Uncharacterized protein n=1 Tax=Aspergillus rambellii TaxID=308745 RepID=A0A0F8X653_9EURO|nr:hypothetical protein ARAM_006758 [Aspergillus rambellii]